MSFGLPGHTLQVHRTARLARILGHCRYLGWNAYFHCTEIPATLNVQEPCIFMLLLRFLLISVPTMLSRRIVNVSTNGTKCPQVYTPGLTRRTDRISYFKQTARRPLGETCPHCTTPHPNKDTFSYIGHFEHPF